MGVWWVIACGGGGAVVVGSTGVGEPADWVDTHVHSGSDGDGDSDSDSDADSDGDADSHTADTGIELPLGFHTALTEHSACGDAQWVAAHPNGSVALRLTFDGALTAAQATGSFDEARNLGEAGIALEVRVGVDAAAGWCGRPGTAALRATYGGVAGSAYVSVTAPVGGPGGDGRFELIGVLLESRSGGSAAINNMSVPSQPF